MGLGARDVRSPCWRTSWPRATISRTASGARSAVSPRTKKVARAPWVSSRSSAARVLCSTRDTSRARSRASTSELSVTAWKSSLDGDGQDVLATSRLGHDQAVPTGPASAAKIGCRGAPARFSRLSGVVRHRHDFEGALQVLEVGAQPLALDGALELHPREEREFLDIVGAEQIERVQQDRRFDPRHATQLECGAEVGPGDERRDGAQRQDVAHVEGDPYEGQGRDRDLEQGLRTELPMIGADRVGAVAEVAEQRAAFLAFLLVEFRAPEVVPPRERTEPGGQGRCVVAISPLQQDLERRSAQAVARTAEAREPRTRCLPDGFFAASDLLLDLVGRVEVEPGLVPERVVRELVARVRDRAKGRSVASQRRVLAHDEERDREVQLSQQLHDARSQRIEVGRILLPARVAVGLHVRPLVVEVERETRECRHSAVPPSARSPSLSINAPAASSAMWTVSLTFRVPLTMCAELTQWRPSPSRRGASFWE